MVKYLTSLYWAIVTITTVGYGDILPVTLLEKAMIIIVLIVGTAIFSVYVSILASLFLDDIKK